MLTFQGWAGNTLDSLRKESAKELDFETLAKVHKKMGNLFVYDNQDSSFYHISKAVELAQKSSNWVLLGNCYIDLARYYSDRYDSAKVVANCNLAIESFRKSDYSIGISNAFVELALLYENSASYTETEIYLKLALDEAMKTNDSALIATVYANTGIYYHNLNRFSDALLFYGNALRIFDRDQPHKSSGLQHNIAQILIDQKDYEQAMQLLKKATATNLQFGVDDWLANNYNELGSLFDKLQKPDSAIAYFNLALELYNALEDEWGQAGVYCNLADVLVAKGDFETAAKLYQKAEKLNLALNNNEWLAINYSHMSALLRKSNEAQHRFQEMEMLDLSKKSMLQAALNYAQRAVELYNAGDFSLPESYLELAEVYTALKDHKNALEAYKIYNHHEDSINSNKLNVEVASLAATLQLKMKENDVMELQRKDILKSAELKQRNTIAIALGILLLVVLASVGYILNRMRIISRQKSIIQLQKMEVEKQREVALKQEQLAVQRKLEVEEKNKEIVDSITYARRIQRAILPTESAISTLFQQSFVLYLPKDIVSGDFYWLKPKVRAKDGNIYSYFAVADCTGHGVPGALVSIVCHNALNKALVQTEHATPAALLNQTRKLLAQDFEKYNEEVQDGMDVSIVRFSHAADGTINLIAEWTGANNPLLIVRNNVCLELKPDKQPVGAHLIEKEFTNHSVSLLEGDTIYLFSDGYQDQFGGASNKKYKYANLKRRLAELNQFSLLEIQEQLLNDFQAWKGDQEQIDDITIAGIRIG